VLRGGSEGQREPVDVVEHFADRRARARRRRGELIVAHTIDQRRECAGCRFQIEHCVSLSADLSFGRT
jgi:hypothetical protein